MNGFVYILQSEKANKFYIGGTNNLERRFKAHLFGNTSTTKRMGDIKLVFHQQYSSLNDARKIERWIKKLKRRDYIEKIIADGYIKKKMGV